MSCYSCSEGIRRVGGMTTTPTVTFTIVCVGPNPRRVGLTVVCSMSNGHLCSVAMRQISQYQFIEPNPHNFLLHYRCCIYRYSSNFDLCFFGEQCNQWKSCEFQFYGSPSTALSLPAFQLLEGVLSMICTIVVVLDPSGVSTGLWLILVSQLLSLRPHDREVTANFKATFTTTGS